MFNLLRQDEKDGEFKLVNVVDKTQIIDDHAFEAMYLGKDTYYYSVVTKCIKKDTYLKALDFANVSRKITLSEDILISMALLGVSKRIVLLEEALYYYYYNNSSSSRTYELNKVIEGLEDVMYIISKFNELRKKKDRCYDIFIHTLIIILQLHILYYKYHIILTKYHQHQYKKYSRYLARLILSLTKKQIKYKQKTLTHKLNIFIKKNKFILGSKL